MLRALIYDAVLVPLTTRWYPEVLNRLPEDAHLLDIGIGTAGALVNNAALLREKRLRVTGIDIDTDYVERARRRVRNAKLEDIVEVKLESVYDHDGGPYDAAYFSASFMLLSEPERALRQVCSQLRAGGQIFFTQTFNERRSRLLEKAKPLLRKLTTIEFGRVTYEDDFTRALRKGGVRLEEFTVMDVNAALSYRLAIAAPNVDHSSAH